MDKRANQLLTWTPSKTTIRSDVELDGDEPQVLQVVPAPPVRSGGGDDEAEPPLKRQRQVNKNEKARKKRITYSVKADCMLMNEVVGDDGIFELHNASKTERCVEITERLGSALNKKLSADGVRKHVDKLEKKYRSKRAKERAMSGQEPHKSIDENELERLMEVYFQKKDDETLVQSKRIESKTKKIEENRAKGLAIRETALLTEKHTTKKSKPAKAPSAFDFLERLEKRADERREQDLERLRSE
ncbi:hypothetical protein GN244_ATG16074 [Phytophthora infestans]|uniref:Uncharacterized protein n=1 Tax=Phytophthora infestans TaxID=4787 RepID=A0A833S3Y4_PHYIN|nr:hypothetical protein GN244_ATG16074 [Phytophthora infestans]KAF4149776.1 hypothetical protein GN958_ATG01035 [Phytophthora infestans]